jgi:NADPH-dependent curcumin reductase CurA
MTSILLLIIFSGVLARDYNHRMDEMIATVKPWLKDGERTIFLLLFSCQLVTSRHLISGTLKFEETVIEGFERLPEALGLLFTGGNIGKMIVKIEE